MTEYFEYRRPGPIELNKLNLTYLELSYEPEVDVNGIHTVFGYTYKTDVLEIYHNFNLVIFREEFNTYIPSVKLAKKQAYFQINTEIDNDEQRENTQVKLPYEECKNALLKQSRMMKEFMEKIL